MSLTTLFRHFFPSVLCLTTILSCSQRKDPSDLHRPDDAHTRLFTFDRSVPGDATVDSTWTQEGITFRDAHFASCSLRHGAVKYYLILPSGNGPWAGAMFFHWLGEPGGDRNEFLDEAIQLAREGVASLLIQGYFPWHEAPANGPADRQQVIDQTTDARRALEILIHEPGVDVHRLAYVGHDYGAMFGAIIAGLETRVKAYVLITATGNFSDWSLKYWPVTAAAGEQAYREALDSVDPVHFVSRSAPAALFFQFSNADIYISRETAVSFSNAASEPKSIRWYDAAHDLNVPAAKADRHAWLVQQLGITVAQ
jgi:dienelactone hydrolase